MEKCATVDFPIGCRILEQNCGHETRDSSVSRLLAGFEESLHVLGEGGSGALSVSVRDELSGVSRRAATLGWSLLAAHASRLADAPSLDPGLLLQGGHLCLLYRQSLEAP